MCNYNNSLVFLGTGAADWPDQVPEEVIINEDRNFRRKCSVLAYGSILIDCGPTVLEAINTFNIDPLQINDVLITHTHSDHFSLQVLMQLVKLKGEHGLHIWGEAKALSRIQGVDGVIFHPLAEGASFKIGDIEIKALPANHTVFGSEEVCLYYLFKYRDIQWLYATDGAWLLRPTWQYLKNQAELDIIIWDATIGEADDDYRIFEHNSLGMIRLMSKTLTRQGVLKSDAKIILTHMARTLHPKHNELEQNLSGEGMIAAYDGMRVLL